MISFGELGKVGMRGMVRGMAIHRISAALLCLMLNACHTGSGDDPRALAIRGLSTPPIATEEEMATVGKKGVVAADYQRLIASAYAGDEAAILSLLGMWLDETYHWDGAGADCYMSNIEQIAYRHGDKRFSLLLKQIDKRHYPKLRFLFFPWEGNQGESPVYIDIFPAIHRVLAEG